MAKKQRLDKAISMQGNLSRSEVKTLIRKGAVTVNGQVVKAADFGVDFDSDTVQVQGKPLCLRMHLYLMLNKPKGVVSASEDKNQPTVVDLVPQNLWRKGLFPAGRLDKDTSSGATSRMFSLGSIRFWMTPSVARTVVREPGLNSYCSRSMTPISPQRTLPLERIRRV